MSRICGVIELLPKRDVEPGVIDSLVSVLRHDPAYHPSTFSSDGAAFAHLTYVGCEQYISAYTDENWICVASGYAVNLREMARSNRHAANGYGPPTLAQLAAQLVAEGDLAAFERLNGLWAFAAWNGTHRQLYLGVDRYGIRPLYYRQKGTQVFFASEVKAISHNAQDLTIDQSAVEDLLVLGMVTDSRTMYHQIKRAPAATILKFDQKSLASNRYWFFDRLTIDPKLSVPDFVDENIRVFRTSIERLRSLAPSAVTTLSSGLDSRRILLELSKTVSPRTFTSSVQMTGYRYDSDALVARALCKELHLVNEHVDLYAPEDEPELIRMAVSVLDAETNQHRWAIPLLRQISLGCGVNFDGLGGDILLFGKQVVDDQARAALDNDRLPQSVLVELGPARSKYLRSRDGAEPLTTRLLRQIGEIPPSPYQISFWFIAQWTRRRTALFGQSLMSMKVESLYPFMDNDHFELCYRLAPEHRMHGNLQYQILSREHADVMSRIPSSHHPGIGVAPDEYSYPFLLPIPSDYAVRRRFFSSLASARELARTPSLLWRLSPACMAIVLGLCASGRFAPPTGALMRRSWRLESLVPVQQCYYELNNQRRQANSLRAVRQYVFGAPS